MTPHPHSGQGEARAELGLQSHRCLERSRNQLQSKVQQLEELPEAPELYGVSRHFLGQDFTGNSEGWHQAWSHTVCLPGRKEQRAQCSHPLGQDWQRQEGEKGERSPPA